MPPAGRALLLNGAALILLNIIAQAKAGAGPPFFVLQTKDLGQETERKQVTHLTTRCACHACRVLDYLHSSFYFLTPVSKPLCCR